MKQFPQLLFSLLLFPLSFFAQSPIFAPVGAVWRYNASDDNGLGSRHYRYVVTADTVINGWDARVMQGEIWNGSAFVPSPVMTRYVSTTADKVFHWVDTSFVLLMDFSAQPGDTIHSAVSGIFPFWNNCYNPPSERVDFYYIIESAGVEEVSGVMLRNQKIIQPWWEWGEWNILGIFGDWGKLTERIGPNPSGTWFGGNLNCIQEPPASLRCYTDNDIFYEGWTEGLPCDSVVSTNVPEQITFRVGPNPVSESISITVPESGQGPFQFLLYDLTGQLIIQNQIQEGDNNISVQHLLHGFYLWEIRQEIQVMESGKLVKSR